MPESGMPYRNLTTGEVKAALDQGKHFRLIDIREPYEHAIAAIEGAELLPMSRAQEWVASLPRDEELVFFCHHGQRSQYLAQVLATQLGFKHVSNMLGGIEDWAARIDPNVPRY